MSGKGGLQKAIIPLKDLPPFKVDISGKIGYYTRYRIVSENKNKTSHWSPVYFVHTPYSFVRTNEKKLEDLLVNKTSSKVVNIVWDPVDIYIEENPISRVLSYDIWLRWSKNGDNGDWTYKERAINTSFNTLIPETYFIGGVEQEAVPNQLEVEIYVSGQDISRNALAQVLLVYKSDSRENV